MGARARRQWTAPCYTHVSLDRDLDLLQRWQAGDRDAGNDLLQRHFSSVCRFFRNKIAGDIDELVQKTFLGCVRGRDAFRQQSSFRSYLFTIARNELYGYLRTLKRDREKLDFGVTSLVDLGTTPTSRIARDQRKAQLLRALRTLPVETQVMLELFYWEDMSAAELADVFAVPAATMRTRLFRARKVLRQQMEDMADEPLSAIASVENLDAWARSLQDKPSDSEPPAEPPAEPTG